MLKLSNLESIGKPVYKFQNNHSVDFDGVDDFIQLGEPISYTQHTISTWIKITNETSARIIFDARDSNQDGILLFVTDTELITHRIGDGTSVDLTTSTPLTNNEWHHVVATYDGDTRKIYTNGTLAASDTISKTIETTTKARIGNASYTDAAPFKGKIDELAIWDRAIAEEEVTKIYRIKYGANLVQNGRFDELGSELVTNGDFATDSDWNNNVGNDWQITNGKLILTTTSSNNVNQAIGLVQNKVYKIVFTVSNTTSGGVRVRLGTGSFTSVFTDGTHTLYLEQTTTNDAFRFYANSSGVFNGQIDNVSVKQVDPNDRWTLGTKWSFGNGFVRLVSSDGSGSGFIQSSVFEIGKTYKITFEAVVVSGEGKVESSGGTILLRINETKTYSHIFVASRTDLYFNRIDAVTDITISNVMVEEQKYVATNLKLNSIPYSISNLRNYYRMGDGILDTHPLICDMVEPSLGSELITNGDYSNGLTGWSADSEWSEENGLAVFDGSGVGSLQQSGVTTVGKTFKLTFDVTEITNRSGLRVINVTFNDTYALGNEINVGTNTFYFTPVNGTGIRFRASSGTTCKIDNVSVKQVNGVAGLMTNMSEADITNDVPS